MIELERSLVGVRNLNVAVKEWDDNVVFLHRIVQGGADRSYGIHVARLAGVPREVNERAKDILAQLEVDHLNRYGESKITPPPRRQGAPVQLTLFEWGDHPVIDKVRHVDVESLDPAEAIALITQWKTEIGPSSFCQPARASVRFPQISRHALASGY